MSAAPVKSHNLSVLQGFPTSQQFILMQLTHASTKRFCRLGREKDGALTNTP
jgi:hypothetical protein